MRLQVLFLLILLPVLTVAETIMQPIQPGEVMGGAVPEVPISHLLDQAYTNMLMGNYLQGEQQYKTLTELDPANYAGWEGLLWAQNMLGKYKQTLKLSSELLRKNPGIAYPNNYRALALLKKGRFPEARHYYQKGLASQPGNLIANQISRTGMAYAYQAMDDYPNSHKNFEIARALEGNIVLNHKPGFGTTVSYKMAGEEKSAYGLKQSISFRSHSLGLAYEDFYVSGDSYRKSYEADYRIQLRRADVSVQGRFLDGENEIVYPAKQAGLELSPKLYAGILAIKPSIMASYSRYPRFDVQQVSFKPRILWRDISIRYALHLVNIDHEMQNADSLRIHQQVELTKSLPWGFGLGLNYGNGNDTWSVDSAGNMIDTFDQMGSYYGISLSKSLWNRFYLYAYYQGWSNEQLLYLSLSGRY